MEQHGPHLPLHTDTAVAEHLARRLAEARDDTVVGPTFAVGASGEHQGFAGTLSIGTAALATVLSELVRSSRESFRGVVIISGHGGNREALDAVASLSSDEGDAVVCFLPHIEGGDAHAGRTETSVMLVVAPDEVHLDRAAPGATQPLGGLIGEIRRAGVIAVSENGVLGDPEGASAAEGQEILAKMCERLERAVAERFD
jgi:creatinine amidohydrolase